jgi:hypothetical protein
MVLNETKTNGDDNMTNFNIENLVGNGIKAKVIDGGKQYTTYVAFAHAAGHLDAVNKVGSPVVNASYIASTCSNEVNVLARGDHGSDGTKIYVCQTVGGSKFLIAEGGIKLIEPKRTFEGVSTDDLYKEIERRAFEAGFKAGVSSTTKHSDAPTRAIKSRADIVEQAKRDVGELEGKMLSSRLNYEGNETFRHLATKVSFEVNNGKRAITALVKGNRNSKLFEVGVARCDPNDCFNEYIGKAIALRRALGLDVPSDYLDAPQPDGFVFGDIVAFNRTGGDRAVRTVKEDQGDRVRFTSETFVHKDAKERYGDGVTNPVVINDTARYK